MPSDPTKEKNSSNTIDWPIGYNDLADWYAHVEKFVGISGINCIIVQMFS